MTRLQTDPPGTRVHVPMVLTDARLIDGTGAPPRPVRAVRVEAGRITRIVEATGDGAGTAGSLDPDLLVGAERIDLEGRTLLPGLWDAHAHLSMVFPQPALEFTPHHELAADRTIRCGRAAMQALQVGATNVRIVGEPFYLDVAWKKAFAAKTFVGPRLFVCGRPLIATGGHGWHHGVSVEVDGPAEVRKAAREQLKRGADQIKLMVTGGVASSTETMHEPQMTFDEIAAAVEVAALKGRKVCAHVGGPEGAKLAVEAGVASIEHGYHLDDEAIAMMVERGTFLVPTLAVTQTTDFVVEHNAPYAVKKILAAAELHRDSFQRALAAGVKIATGEDMPVPFADWIVPEIETMVACGMEPMAALLASTRNAAELCDALDELGTVEIGKIADLIVVDGDPSVDVSQLRALHMVIKEGDVVVDRRDETAPTGAAA